MPLDPRLSEKIRRLNTLFSEQHSKSFLFSYYTIVELWSMQQQITKKLDTAQSNQDLLNILTKPVRYQSQKLTNKELLRKNHFSWPYWILTTVLIVMTFPLSIPILSLWSTKNRGTLQFWKATHALLIEDISTDALMPPTSVPLTLNSTHPITKESPMDRYGATSSSQMIVKRLKSAEPIESSAPNIISSIVPAIKMDSFFSNMAITNLQRQVGNPVITSYTIENVSNDTNVFSINLECEFDITNGEPHQETLKLYKQHILPETFQPVENMIPFTCPQEKRNFFKDAAVQIGLKNSSDFYKTLLNAAETQDINEKENLYLKAYSRAKTDKQRTQVLEHLVNEYYAFYQYQVRNKHIDPEDSNAESQEKINKYLSYLPKNYQQTCDSAIALTESFNAILELITYDQFDLAWAKYQDLENQKMLPLSHFLQRTFPNLQATWYQLSAIFVITQHKRKNREFRIYERSEFEHLEIFFEMTYRIIDGYNKQSSSFIEQHVLTPLQQFRIKSKQSVDNMSKQERDEIFSKDMFARIKRFNLDEEFTHRKTRSHNKDNEPRVTELDSDEESESLLKTTFTG
ncbi:MAG: hypothetical protein Q8R83_00380 [Legionellaceae bacterium]|nr:hypothetical protein [Legionellaceae bacterium]